MYLSYRGHFNRNVDDAEGRLWNALNISDTPIDVLVACTSWSFVVRVLDLNMISKIDRDVIVQASVIILESTGALMKGKVP